MYVLCTRKMAVKTVCECMWMLYEDNAY